MGTTAAIIVSAAIQTGTTVAANRQRRRARAAEIRKQNVLAARERRKLVREARVAQSQVQQAAIASGAPGASSPATASSAISANLGSNISFLNRVTGLDREITNRNQTAQNFDDFGRLASSTASGYRQLKDTGAFSEGGLFG